MIKLKWVIKVTQQRGTGDFYFCFMSHSALHSAVNSSLPPLGGHRVFWLGDSCIKRCEEASEWDALSSRGLHSENAGWNGERSAQLIRRAQALVRKEKSLLTPEPAAVVVCIGANDLMIETPDAVTCRRGGDEGQGVARTCEV